MARAVARTRPRNGSRTRSPNIRISWETITPAKAEQYLETMRENRNLSSKTVNRYARDMKQGRWTATAEPIRFDSRGRLIDGQHRLWACVESDCSFFTAVARGVPEDAHLDIDTNRARTYGDHLGITGRSSRPNQVASVCRMLYYYEKTGSPIPLSGKGPTPTNRELDEIYGRHGDRITLAIEAFPPKRGLLAPYSVLIWFLVVASRTNENSRVVEFLDKFEGGENLERKDPVFVLRKRLYEYRLTTHGGGGRASRIYSLALLIKGWNMFREGRQVSQIRFGSSESFPEIQ